MLPSRGISSLCRILFRTNTAELTVTVSRQSRHQPSWNVRTVPIIEFAGSAVEKVSSLNLLGVAFDSRLLYGPHLQAVALRANQRIGFLRKASAVLDPAAGPLLSKDLSVPWWSTAPWHGWEHVPATSRDLTESNNVLTDSLAMMQWSTVFSSAAFSAGCVSCTSCWVGPMSRAYHHFSCRRLTPRSIPGLDSSFKPQYHTGTNCSPP